MRHCRLAFVLGLSLFVCASCKHRASKSEIGYFGIAAQPADKARLKLAGAVTEIELTGPELRSVLDAFVDENLIGWGDYGKLTKVADVVFLKGAQEISEMTYYNDSVVRQSGVFVKLRQDPIKLLIENPPPKRAEDDE